MWERREKILCYNCDEKFSRGHRCAEKKFYLLDVDSPPTPEIFYDAQDLVDDQFDIQQPLVDPPSHENNP